jgi:hypothetical protein
MLLKQFLLLLAGLGLASVALACAETREVPLTPERAATYEKQRQEARANVEKARREKNQVDMDLSRAEVSRIDQILGSGRELVVMRPGGKAPSSKCAG